ncbi:HepT-like ribonuclease domain-containing protein [Parapedobacter tibetensis]|uniref:HepT-like ribonuclease domain-containing protein n=1 Tax=Parapedobacter tibetensis TaxID=2972951 RepID=UPI00214D7209|nr:HepT-like ribonuclease domain-containing protein [Parapedobacter tibetensis]
MLKDAEKYLEDIRYAIGLAMEFRKDIVTYFDFEADLKTQSAVERQIAIVGEAVNKLTQLTPKVALKNCNKIRGMRNILIHSYDQIDPAIVWGVLTKDLPPPYWPK